jgi:hypothetical protein
MQGKYTAQQIMNAEENSEEESVCSSDMCSNGSDGYRFTTMQQKVSGSLAVSARLWFVYAVIRSIRSNSGPILQNATGESRKKLGSDAGRADTVSCRCQGLKKKRNRW